MKKHQITLELGNAELNALLYAIESLVFNASPSRPTRSPESLEAELMELTPTNGHAWLILCLARSYRGLLAHWSRKNTRVMHEIIAPLSVERVRLPGESFTDAERRRAEAETEPHRRALAMAVRIGESRKRSARPAK